MKRAPGTSRAKVSRWKPAGRVIGVSCATAGAARSISTMPTRAQRMPESYYAPQVRLALEQVADELLEILDPERLVEDGCARLLEEVFHPDRLRAPRHEGDAPRQLGLAALELTVETRPVELRHAQIAEDQIVRPALDVGQGGQTVDRDVHGVPIRRQDVGHQRGEWSLVIHHQDSFPGRYIGARHDRCPPASRKLQGGGHGSCIGFSISYLIFPSNQGVGPTKAGVPGLPTSLTRQTGSAAGPVGSIYPGPRPLIGPANPDRGDACRQGHFELLRRPALVIEARQGEPGE